MEKEMDVAKRLKIVEWLKTEVLDHMSRLFKGIWDGNTHRITDSLASLVVSCYILGRRLGLPYDQLDQAMKEKLGKHRKEGHQLEDWYGDISSLEDHLRKR
ncbi:MazG-like family protein [Paenibacillus turpanensis]|uniref:MazG-like family protein n=1 Tax=Paenibacillus turpanensis TaxID=2689078 RepID=UPI00140C4D66|nr:MazG-like family protein [Paenibacillus turpanensis]